ncbi:MAG: 5-dehydro-2-deoxygluconokinase [Proteobacteria bacterium]|nr:5-dehydro-2-deoxygluconokinase [Pseudomonadota bacterium]
MTQNKKLDVICLGRAGVDFYGDQIGSRLEDMTTMSMYLGGSSCNMASNTARIGLKSAMLTRVGDDHMGRFLYETLLKEGVDVSHVITDHDRLTALVILGVKDKETFPLIFYRENCADMAISTNDFNEEFIASSKALVITGTHLSTSGTKATCLKALEAARNHGTKTVLDVDYRPVLWGLTGRGEGENRFIENKNVTQHLQRIIPWFDLIVGTEEEIHIAGGSTNTIESLKNIRKLTDAEIVVKRGALGCSIFDDSIPESLDDGFTSKGVQVDVLNVLGAGDAFISGFLKGWIREESYQRSCDYANACGALVVSRHGCAPAMPSLKELNYYLDNMNKIKRPDLDPTLNYLHRVTTHRKSWGELLIFAFDHRKQLEEMAENAGVSPHKISDLKQLMVRAVTELSEEQELQGKVGVLIDGTHGQDALNQVTGQNWWIGRPVELPGSRPLQFEAGDNIGQIILSWPKEQIVKCLVYYHPDDENNLKLAQQKKIQLLYEACLKSKHELLLEIIIPADMEDDGTALPRTMEQLYEIEIYPEWWKIKPPSKASWIQINKVIKNKALNKPGILLLGLDAPEEELAEGFKRAAGNDLCHGFAVGRTIFGLPAKEWLAGNIDDHGLISQLKENFLNMIEFWRYSQN